LDTRKQSTWPHNTYLGQVAVRFADYTSSDSPLDQMGLTLLRKHSAFLIPNRSIASSPGGEDRLYREMI